MSSPSNRRISPWIWSLALVLPVALIARLPLAPAQTATENSNMDNERLGKLLKEHFPDNKIEGRPGLWRILLTDDNAKEGSAKKEDSAADGGSAPKQEGSIAKEGSAFKEEDSDLKEGDLKEGSDTKEGSASKEEERGIAAPTATLPKVMMVMTDERADRMRIMMPVRPFNPQNPQDLQLALVALHANYDRALDARYAVHDGVLWSAFIHPLGSLSPADLTNAINQVETLRNNTGTSFSSGGLLFGAPRGGRRGGPQQKLPKPTDPGDNVT